MDVDGKGSHDHQESGWLEDGPWKGPSASEQFEPPPLLVELLLLATVPSNAATLHFGEALTR